MNEYEWSQTPERVKDAWLAWRLGVIKEKVYTAYCTMSQEFDEACTKYEMVNRVPFLHSNIETTMKVLYLLQDQYVLGVRMKRKYCAGEMQWTVEIFDDDLVHTEACSAVKLEEAICGAMYKTLVRVLNLSCEHAYIEIPPGEFVSSYNMCVKCKDVKWD